MKKVSTKKNIADIKRMSSIYPKSINEALHFNQLENEADDMDMEIEDEMDMEEPKSPKGSGIENFITNMRKQSLDIMSELADTPDDPVYDFAKKIWQLAEKAYNDKKEGKDINGQPIQKPMQQQPERPM